MLAKRFERIGWRLGLAAAAAGLGLALSFFFFPRGFEVLRGRRELELPLAAMLGAKLRGGPGRQDRVPYQVACVHPLRPKGNNTFAWLPRTIARDYYPDDPRGYFRQQSADEARLALQWGVVAKGDTTALYELVRADEDTAILRVGAGEARRQTPWDVTLERHERIEVQAGQVLHVALTARAALPKRVGPSIIDTGPPPGAIGAVKPVEVGAQWQTHRWQFSPAERTATVTLVFNLAEDATPLEVRWIEATLDERPLPLPFDLESPPVHFVEYVTNNLGFRDQDVQPPRPAGVQRILMLGDSFTFGIGVNYEDTFCHLLQTQLNERGKGRLECLNFGTPGYGSFDQRLLYETRAEGVEADVVVVAMCYNDHIPVADYLEVGGRAEKYEAYTREHGYQPCVDQLQRIRELAEARGARLALVSLCIDDNPGWKALEEAVFPQLSGAGVPCLSLREAMQRRELFGAAAYVHPRDQHPNELAHRAIADEIAAFLEREGLLTSGEEESR